MDKWKYKGKLARLMQLAHLLNRPEGATIKQICNEIGYTSRSSAYYAIRALWLDLDYPVRELPDRNENNETVYIADSREIISWNLNLVKGILTEDDAMILNFMIENYMSQSSLSKTINKNSFMQNLNLLMSENHPNLIPVLMKTYDSNSEDVKASSRIFSLALKASQEHQKCIVEYSWLFDEIVKEELYPLKCVDTPLGIHLLSLNGKGITSSLRLDLIKSIKLLGKCEYPFDRKFISEIMSDPFCIWPNKEAITCKIEMSPPMGLVESKREWSENVTFEQLENKKWICTVKTRGELMLTLYILSLGQDAKVLEPQIIVDNVKRSLKHNLDKYEEQRIDTAKPRKG